MKRILTLRSIFGYWSSSECDDFNINWESDLYFGLNATHGNICKLRRKVEDYGKPDFENSDDNWKYFNPSKLFLEIR